MGDTLGLICKVQVTGADVGDADGAPSYSGAWTGRWFARQRPRVVYIARSGSDSVRFNAEADSLNRSVLGPDATSDTPEFELFVKQLVTEMTVEAGQKCAAIRRALVPSELVDDVLEATRERLAKVVVGAPGTEGVTMGALASLDQRECSDRLE